MLLILLTVYPQLLVFRSLEYLCQILLGDDDFGNLGINSLTSYVPQGYHVVTNFNLGQTLGSHVTFESIPHLVKMLLSFSEDGLPLQLLIDVDGKFLDFRSV